MSRQIEEATMENNHPTREQRAAAYAAVKERFNLKATQRDMLDASHLYRPIITAAHEGDWTTVEELLFDGGITR